MARDDIRQIQVNEALKRLLVRRSSTDTMREPLPPPSLMVRKFLNRSASGNKSAPSQEYLKPADYYEGEYCFVYGTLMDPEILSQVLKKSDPFPIMSSARVIGYDVKLWGPYPALIDGKPRQAVYGMAFENLVKNATRPTYVI